MPGAALSNQLSVKLLALALGGADTCSPSIRCGWARAAGCGCGKSTGRSARSAMAEPRSCRPATRRWTPRCAISRSGLDAIEERARSELGMIRQNEIFFQLIDEKSATPR